MDKDRLLKLNYTGKDLEEAIETVTTERKPLIESFLYEQSSLLLYADDGVGKSLLAIQSMMQATVADSKVFGEFDVPRACKVLYFQMERSKEEALERMKHLRHVIPFDANNFILSLALQGKNLQIQKQFDDALTIVDNIIVENNFWPDIVVFDPIYALVRDDLATAEACNTITNFFRLIQLMYNTSLFCTSHTNRGIRGEDGKRIGKDMYGNRFLSAYFTGSYHMTSKDDGSGTVFNRNKNSHSNLEKKFELIFDPSNYKSWTINDGKYTKKDKLLNYLKSCKNFDKEFSFDDMQANSGLSDSPLRGYLAGQLKDTVIFQRKVGNNKSLYKYFG